jgi:hypothetical protein
MTAGRESSPSEETPLIPSSRPDDESIAAVSVPRGIAIAFFMELLILIQSTLKLFGCDAVFTANRMVCRSAINISMMTTAQSEIAADLDAFDQATWFTSAYLV